MKPEVVTDQRRDYNGTYILFEFYEMSKSGATCQWTVASTDGFSLGTVKWFGRWHQYAFFPASGTVFEKTCLTEIGLFLSDRTEEHRLETGMKRTLKRVAER